MITDVAGDFIILGHHPCNVSNIPAWVPMDGFEMIQLVSDMIFLLTFSFSVTTQAISCF